MNLQLFLILLTNTNFGATYNGFVKPRAYNNDVCYFDGITIERGVITLDESEGGSWDVQEAYEAIEKASQLVENQKIELTEMLDELIKSFVR